MEVKFYPYKKKGGGGKKLLAMLKEEGHKKFLGSCTCGNFSHPVVGCKK